MTLKHLTTLMGGDFIEVGGDLIIWVKVETTMLLMRKLHKIDNQ